MIELYSTIQYENESWIVLNYSDSNNQYKITKENRNDIWVHKDELIIHEPIQTYNRTNSIISQSERFKQLNYVREYKEFFQSKGISEFNVFLENVIYHFYQGRTDKERNFIYSICPYEVCKRIEYIAQDEIVSADVIKKDSFLLRGTFKRHLLEVPTLIKIIMKGGKVWHVGIKRETKTFDITKFKWV